jgi:flavin reductase (DIM6/NTAB) family NADH-FMN oxidoreductase RutF
MPIINTNNFREACRCFVTGVAVVAARDGELKVGMTINSFASLSLDPPLVLWSLRNGARSRPVYENADTFTISVLSSEQLAIAEHFARGVRDAFDGCSITPAACGTPLISGALAHFECRTHQIADGGDHRLVIGSVIQTEINDGSPLLFYRGRLLPYQSETRGDL